MSGALLVVLLFVWLRKRDGPGPAHPTAGTLAGVSTTTTQRQPIARMAVLVALAVALGLVVLLAYGAEEILDAVSGHDGIALWDRPVLNWAVSARSPGLTQAALWFTHSGGVPWQPSIMGVIIAVMCLRWRDWTPLALWLIAEGGAAAITLVGKNTIGRPRPPLADAIAPFETSFSFPSGHTLTATASAGIVAYLLIRHRWASPRWQRALVVVAAVVYVATMGLSRVYLGYHWLTDIVAAVSLGGAWLVVVITGHRAWLVLERRAHAGPTRLLATP